MHLTKPNRLQELDALRGIAALLIVFFHFTIEKTQYSSFLKFGTTGVDLFFMISGFVIFMSVQKVSRGIDFVINRFSRLYPTYWACVTFTFILLTIYYLYKGKFHLLDNSVQFLGNLTMFQFYLGIPDIDGPYWTMIIEMTFYLLIILLFELKLLKHLNIIWLIICSLTVFAVYYLYELKFVQEIITWVPLLQFLPLFFSGIIFYKIYTNKINLLSNYLLLIFCFACQLLLFPYTGRSKGFISWFEYHSMLLLYFTLFVLFVNNKLSFIVNITTLFLGRISYALYLIHQCVSVYFIIPLFNDLLGINFWIVTFFIDLPIIIGIAACITYKIEIPYSRKLKEKLHMLSIKNTLTEL